MIPYYLKIIVISENYIKDIFQNLYLYRGVPSRIEGFRSLPLIQETVCDLQGVPNFIASSASSRHKVISMVELFSSIVMVLIVVSDPLTLTVLVASF